MTTLSKPDMRHLIRKEIDAVITDVCVPFKTPVSLADAVCEFNPDFDYATVLQETKRYFNAL